MTAPPPIDAAGAAIVDGAPLDTVAAWASLAPAMRVGDGVFRTMRVHRQRVLWLEDHLEALRASVDTAGYDRAGYTLRLDRTLATVHEALPDVGVVRLFATPRGDNFGRSLLTPLSVWALVDPKLPVPDAAGYARGVIVGDSPVPHPGLGAYGKTCGYAWARTAMRLAYRARIDDALLLRDGAVVEAATAAVVWREGDAWHGVPATSGALPSVTRERFAGVVGGLREAAPTPVRLRDADQVALLSSLRLAIGVRRYGEREWPQPDAGLDEVRAAWLDAGA